MDSSWIVDGPQDAQHTFAFAHGAGASMDSPFMQRVAEGLAQAAIRVVRFEFPYMAGRRTTGVKRGPDRPLVLEQTWLDVVSALGPVERLFIGGKSMGGRIATLIAERAGVAGVVCLGYPFHPPGKPERLRVEHLRSMKTPCLILQGERDSMGKRDEVESYALSPQVRVEWFEDGDHSLKPRVKSGFSEQAHLERAIQLAAAFIGK